ncbi:immunoglobulin lambda-like polypeptide 5 isoform X1 [Embiotoca jacksoni]|uniref:immunoglobulin lambda-like polypeptide 5 isoform X1 n=1 Tax=Embiotoca jacksoni TaxID=100190 RepID=UPI003703AA37
MTLWTRSLHLTRSAEDRFLYQSVSLWKVWIFGSGTKLYVTDKPVVKPEVIMYPAACRAHLEGRTFLLCLASAMFPPEVQFSWKRQNKNDSLEELLSSEGEQLELREPGRTASIRVVDQDDLHTFKYHCYVKHEWDTVKNQTEEGNEGLVTVFSRDSASRGDSVKEDGHVSLQLQTSVSILFQRFQLQQPPILQRQNQQTLHLCSKLTCPSSLCAG